jgi:hypothetical protein
VVRQGYIRERQNIDSVGLLAANNSDVHSYLDQQKAGLDASEQATLKHIQFYYEQRARRLGRQPETPTLTEAELRADQRVPAWLEPNIADMDEICARLGPSVFGQLQILSYTRGQSGGFAAYSSGLSCGLPAAFSKTLFETLNFINGKRSIKDIRDAVSAEFDPVPLGVIEDLINTLEKGKFIKIRT